MTLESVVIVLAAVLPGAVLFALLTRGRRQAPLTACVGLGVVACIPALLVERIIGIPTVDSLGGLLLFAMAISVIEEVCKFFLYFAVPAPRDEPYDIIVRFACIGLGFATAENIAYCLAGGTSLALARAFTAVPAHVMFAIIEGSALARARARERIGWSSGHLVAGGLFNAIMAHGLYDVLAFQGSDPALIVLIFGLAAGTIWSLRVVRAARYELGGVAHGDGPLVPPPLGLPNRRPATSGDPSAWTAGFLGLVPGLGQWSNGEAAKAVLFLGLALVNLVLYAVAVRFAGDPTAILDGLKSAGMRLRLNDTELVAVLRHRDLIPTFILGLLLCGWLGGALEAWHSARTRSTSTAPQGVILSYVCHLLVLGALLLAPLAAAEPATGSTRGAASGRTNAAPADRKHDPSTPPVTLTWVKITRIEGWKPPDRAASVPAPHAATPPPVGVRPAPPRPPVPARPAPAPVHVVSHPSPRHAAPIEVPAPQVAVGPSFRRAPDPRLRKSPHDARPPRDDFDPAARDADPSEAPSSHRDGHGNAMDPPDRGDEARGQDGWFSYQQYLTARLREGRPPRQDYFFKFVRHNVWVIVRYEIDVSGALLSADVLESTASREEADRAVAVLRSCAPFRPLPPGMSRITVTELFWTREFRDFPRGSLAESLSLLPDGRSIRE